MALHTKPSTPRPEQNRLDHFHDTCSGGGQDKHGDDDYGDNTTHKHPPTTRRRSIPKAPTMTSSSSTRTSRTSPTATSRRPRRTAACPPHTHESFTTRTHHYTHDNMKDHPDEKGDAIYDDDGNDATTTEPITDSDSEPLPTTLAPNTTSNALWPDHKENHDHANNSCTAPHRRPHP